MRRLVIAAAVAVAVAISGGAIAYASIPDSSGVIHGCYTVKGGSLRVIDTAKGQTCATGQHSLNWNQKGQQGLAGPPGPAGVSGFSVARCTVEDASGPLVVDSSSGGTCTASGSASTGVGVATLTCPVGKQALSASWQYNTPHVLSGYLNPGATGYDFTLDLEIAFPNTVGIEVTCANVS
jgi:hypothetical protein